MFEKDAEVYYNGQYDAWLEGEDSFALEEEIEQAFKDGAEFGYNKAEVNNDNIHSVPSYRHNIIYHRICHREVTL